MYFTVLSRLLKIVEIYLLHGNEFENGQNE